MGVRLEAQRRHGPVDIKGSLYTHLTRRQRIMMGTVQLVRTAPYMQYVLGQVNDAKEPSSCLRMMHMAVSKAKCHFM
jgi:hypothetical protein